MREYSIRALRWSEKYTKTDMVYLASGGVWSLVGQTSAVLSTLALAIVVGRFVPKEVYGSYKYILSVVAILSTLSLSGLSGAVFTSAAHGFDGALPEGFRENLRWSVFIFLGAFGMAAYYFWSHNTALAFGILLGGSLSPLLASANLANTYLSAKKDFRRATLYFDVAANITPAAVLILTAVFFPSPLWLVAAYFISNTAVALYLYRRTLALYSAGMHKRDGGMLSYGKHLSAMGILSAIAGNLDQILLFHYVGAAELAIYNFAIAIPDQAKGPLKMFDSMVQARFAARTDEEIRRGMKDKISLLFLFYGTCVVLYIVAAPFIYRTLFPNYIDAAFFSQIYAVSLIISFLGPVTSFFSVKKKIKQQYIVNFAFSIFQVIAMSIGIITWGLLGLIIARVATRFFTAGTTYVLYRYSSE